MTSLINVVNKIYEYNYSVTYIFYIGDVFVEIIACYSVIIV